jgi:hypothetical protein
MPSRATRIWVALSGLAGVAMLIAHFQFAARVPGDDSPAAAITGTRRVDEVVGQAGLAPAARCQAGGYSLGMRRRLGIAAALLGDPPVGMLDEPFNGMDPEGIVWIRGFLPSLAAQGRAVLVASHLMSELQDIADHLVVIGRGKVIADISVTDLIAATSSGRVTLRTTTAQPEATTVLANADATVAPPDWPSRPPPACAACPSAPKRASVCSPPGPPPRSWPAACCSGCETREPGPAMTIPSPHCCQRRTRMATDATTTSARRYRSKER